ncbi:hypothetical protein ERJ75_001714900 [Trypanosoma vivax]|nr:hypothetical protein ERJ75_001714900 [Trypanosoma vivax]
MRSALPHSDRAPAGNRASSACAVLSAQPCVSAGGDRRRLTRGARRACAECGVPSARRNQLCAFGCRPCALVRLRPARLLVEPSPALARRARSRRQAPDVRAHRGAVLASAAPRRLRSGLRGASFRHGHGRRSPSQAAGHGTVRRARLCKRRSDDGTRRSTALRLQATRVAWLRQVAASAKRTVCIAPVAFARADNAHGEGRRAVRRTRSRTDSHAAVTVQNGRRQQLVRADCAKRIAG